MPHSNLVTREHNTVDKPFLQMLLMAIGSSATAVIVLLVDMPSPRWQLRHGAMMLTAAAAAAAAAAAHLACTAGASCCAAHR
jgi:hypothetical protein